MTLKSIVRALAVLMVTLWLLPAIAQPSGARGDDFLYRVIQGDTLGELAQRYTQNTANWTVLQRLNQIEDPYRLPIAKVLRIPFSMIPVREGQATVLHVVGQVQLDGHALVASTQVQEGQTVITGANGFAALQLSDDSLVTVPASSKLVVFRLRQFVGTGLIDAIMTMQTGSLETRVSPNDTGVGRFEVRTPVSVTGVRGTRMRVHATAQGSRSEVLQGQAQVDGFAQVGALLGAEQGVAVDLHGTSLGVRPLLPAPELSIPLRGPRGWSAEFKPVAAASAYTVSVARDAQGASLVSQQQITEPPAYFSASGPGTHYVFVRAVDAAGLGGMDAQQPFEGNLVLLDERGSPILTADRHLITVADH